MTDTDILDDIIIASINSEDLTDLGNEVLTILLNSSKINGEEVDRLTGLY